MLLSVRTGIIPLDFFVLEAMLAYQMATLMYLTP
jgi:hypothetical protein